MLRDHIIVGINRFEKQDDTHEKVRRIDTVTLRPINAQLKLNGYETKEAHECGQRFHFFTSSKILSVLGLLEATIRRICMPITNLNSTLNTNKPAPSLNGVPLLSVSSFSLHPDRVSFRSSPPCLLLCHRFG